MSISKETLNQNLKSIFGYNSFRGDQERIILNLLKGNVSILVEAAFQHKLWDLVVPRINEIALTYFIVCVLGAEISARRHLESGLAAPNREFYHGDKRVVIFRETGEFEPGGGYIPQEYDVPTLGVSTIDGYMPSLEEIVKFFQNVE